MERKERKKIEQALDLILKSVYYIHMTQQQETVTDDAHLDLNDADDADQAVAPTHHAGSYVDSPACKLLASHCACCGRPLVDSASVEAGVGPECRKKHGFGVPNGPADFVAAVHLLAALDTSYGLKLSNAGEAVIKEDAHKACNILTHQAALTGSEKAAAIAHIIAVLGYTQLAAKVAQNAGALRVEVVEHPTKGTSLKVTTPYSPEFNKALWKRGARNVWESGKNTDAKGNRIPKGRYVGPSFRKELWAALSDAFPGQDVAGPKGISTLPSKDVA